jgi:hypothetical protein
MVAVVGLAGCGGSDSDDGAASPQQPRTTAPSGDGEPIVIKTRATLPTGKVLSGSTVGGESFCAQGTFADQHGTASIGLVDRSFTCPDGTLQIGFDPGTPEGDTQSGPWRIIAGTGAYADWRGGGEMTVTYDASDDSEHPEHAREAFTGNVTR